MEKKRGVRGCQIGLWLLPRVHWWEKKGALPCSAEVASRNYAGPTLGLLERGGYLAGKRLNETATLVFNIYVPPKLREPYYGSLGSRRAATWLLKGKQVGLSGST